LLKIVAASDFGLVTAKASTIQKCVKAYRSFIDDRSLRRDQIGQARIYAGNYSEVAAVDYNGMVKLAGRP
jgi:hypothetical protein